MPNWCYNHLSINTTNNEKILSFLNNLYEASNSGKLNEFVIPYSEMGKDEYDYNSCIEHWGTKWDIDLIDSELSYDDNNINLEISFNTAWSPNIPVIEKLYEKLFEMDDQSSIHLYYEEPGMNFYGIYKDGEDECRDMGVLYHISKGNMEEIEVKEGVTDLIISKDESDLFFIVKEKKKYDDYDLVEDWSSEIEEFICFSNAGEETSLYKVQDRYYINSYSL